MQRVLEYKQVQARHKLAETEKRPSGVLYERGVDDKDFGIIRSKGDRALFNMDTAMLKRKLGAPAERAVTGFLLIISIKAKDFATEMTSVNVQQKDFHGGLSIEHEHIDNNRVVRDMLVCHGFVPEKLPTDEDIRKAERRLASEAKKMLPKNKK